MMMSRFSTMGQRLFQLQRRAFNAVAVSDLIRPSEMQTMVRIMDDSSPRQAAKLLQGNNVGALIVVNQEERVIGIMTSRDIQRAVANYNSMYLSSCKTKDIMTRMRHHSLDPSFVTPDCQVEKAAEIMQKRNIRHLPVMDVENKRMGMVSFNDVIDEVMKANNGH